MFPKALSALYSAPVVGLNVNASLNRRRTSPLSFASKAALTAVSAALITELGMYPMVSRTAFGSYLLLKCIRIISLLSMNSPKYWPSRIMSSAHILRAGVADTVRSQIIEMLKVEAESGFVDFITLSSSLLFSMNYATTFEAFSKMTLYNNIRQSNYSTDGYLDGIHIVKMDYKELFAKYRGRPDVVFLIDPPYLSTDAGTYSGYWKLKDYLDVLHTLKDTNYFYFTSNKSNIIELCDWLEKNMQAANPFNGAVKVEMATQLNRSARYTDIMLYKIISKP